MDLVFLFLMGIAAMVAEMLLYSFIMGLINFIIGGDDLLDWFIPSVGTVSDIFFMFSMLIIPNVRYGRGHVHDLNTFLSSDPWGTVGLSFLIGLIPIVCFYVFIVYDEVMCMKKIKKATESEA